MTENYPDTCSPRRRVHDPTARAGIGAPRSASVCQMPRRAACATAAWAAVTATDRSGRGADVTGEEEGIARLGRALPAAVPRTERAAGPRTNRGCTQPGEGGEHDVVARRSRAGGGPDKA